MTIHLPGQGFLALDAKAPMDAYLRACGIEDSGEDAEARRRAELAAHAKALRSHVEALASRDYARALGSSPELVILFVPSEAALSAALRADAALLDDAMARGVALCSPVTLLAVARTCATAWARTTINEQADQVIALGRDLYERLGVVAGHMDNLGKNLAKSVDFYNKAVSSMETRLLSRARAVTALESASKKPMTATDTGPAALQHPRGEGTPGIRLRLGTLAAATVVGLERIRRDLDDAIQEGLIRHVRLNLLVFLAGANHGDADGVLEVSGCFELARAVLLRHGLRGLVLIQETPEGGDEPGDAALGHVDVPGPEHVVDAIDDLREGPFVGVCPPRNSPSKPGSTIGSTLPSLRE